MSPSDLILATMLLSAPVGTPEQVPPPDRWQVMQSAIHHTAIDWEILDSRETRYVLAKPEDFQEDLDFLRKRRLDLENAPKVSESDRLPSRQAVNDYIRFNRAYRKNLETRLVWEPDRAGVIGEAIRETERLYKMWDAIRDAKCDFHYITVRRLALVKLKELLGPDIYSTGELPPYVPEWRFAVMR
jgi:hypothetical protein